MKNKNVWFLIVGVVVLIVVVVFLFGGNDGFYGEVEEFNVEAFRFGYSPDVIRVELGDFVRIVINNSDGIHGIRVPEFGVDGIDVIEFVVDKKGEFAWRCNNFCGDGHSEMSGTLIVE